MAGGMCQVSIKYMNEMYDENVPSSYISYLDAKFLNGLAMCQALPHKDSRFVKDFSEEQLNTLKDTSVVLNQALI